MSMTVIDITIIPMSHAYLSNTYKVSIALLPSGPFQKCPSFAGVSSLGVPWHPQILADQLTLSQPGGKIMPTWHPRIFRLSDGPALPFLF